MQSKTKCNMVFWELARYFKFLNYLLSILLLMSNFADFEFGGILFSKIISNFCRHHAMPILKMQQFSFKKHIRFSYKVEIILYLQARNSITHLTLLEFMRSSFLPKYQLKISRISALEVY